MKWKYVLLVVLVVALLMLSVKIFAMSNEKRIPGGADSNTLRQGAERAFKTGLKAPLDTTQKDSLQAIAEAFLRYGDGDLRKYAYILATAWHESKLKPIREYRAKAGTELYDIQNRYWNTGYYGRGFVQLTWEKNYLKMSSVVGRDLVANPDLALDPSIAAKILVYGMMNGSFTGKKLSAYATVSGMDYYNARRVVNGTDKAFLIAGYAEKLEAHLTNVFYA